MSCILSLVFLYVPQSFRCLYGSITARSRCHHREGGTWHPHGKVGALLKAAFGSVFPLLITLKALFSWGLGLLLVAHGIAKEVGLRITSWEGQSPFLCSVFYEVSLQSQSTELLNDSASTPFQAFNSLQIYSQSLGLWRCKYPSTHWLTSIVWSEGEGLLGSHV